MPVQGFTLDPKDPTKRRPCEYGSHEERAWCECSELADAKLWQEADTKLNEYYDACGGFIRGSRDAILTAKIAIGLATTKDDYDKQLYDNACKTLAFAMFKDDGGEAETLSGMVEDLSEGQVKQTIPLKTDNDGTEWTDYSKASIERLEEAANLLLRLFTSADESALEISHYQDNSHDRMHCIIDALLEKNEKDKAREYIDKVLGLPYSAGFFKPEIEEGWNEALESRSVKKQKTDERGVRRGFGAKGII